MGDDGSDNIAYCPAQQSLPHLRHICTIQKSRSDHKRKALTHAPGCPLPPQVLLQAMQGSLGVGERTRRSPAVSPHILRPSAYRRQDSANLDRASFPRSPMSCSSAPLSLSTTLSRARALVFSCSDALLAGGLPLARLALRPSALPCRADALRPATLSTPSELLTLQGRRPEGLTLPSLRSASTS